jgi:hypothetical protein
VTSIPHDLSALQNEETEIDEFSIELEHNHPCLPSFVFYYFDEICFNGWIHATRIFLIVPTD